MVSWFFVYLQSMQEIYRKIDYGSGQFYVTDRGNFSRFKTSEYTPLVGKDGYRHITLEEVGYKKQTFRCARLVAKAFPEICGEWFEGCVVNHRNKNKTDDRASNIEVCSQGHNVRYSIEDRGSKRSPKIGVVQYKDKEYVAEYVSMRKAAKKTGISYSCIRKCVYGELEQAGGFQFKEK